MTKSAGEVQGFTLLEYETKCDTSPLHEEAFTALMEFLQSEPIKAIFFCACRNGG